MLWKFLASMVVLALTMLPAAVFAAAPSGFVAGVHGKAELVRGAETLSARIGQQVFVGDFLVTGKKSRLKILLSDDSVLALGSGSRVELNEHLFRPSQDTRVTRVNLHRGVLRALVQQVVGGKKADFEVKHGTAVAGVRGTEFAVIQEEQGVRLVTFSGGVEWSNGGEEKVLVAAGQGSAVRADRVGPAQALAAADIKAVRGATETQQAPTALAWNLNIGDKVSRKGAPGTRGGMAQDVEVQGEQGSGVYDYDYDGGGEGYNVGGSGPEDHSRYAGFLDEVDGDPALNGLIGDWESGFAQDTSRTFPNSFSLKINVNRAQ